MITLAVALLLGATSVFGACPIKCPPKCTLTWTSYPNHQVKFLVKQTNIVSEDACKAACEANSTCFNIDWNFIDNVCFFGTVQNPTPRYPDTAVNHHDLTRTCVENCDVQAWWILFKLHQTRFLVKQKGITSVTDCRTACEASSTCWTIDWNFKENSCWFGPKEWKLTRVASTDVDHYELIRFCYKAESIVPSWVVVHSATAATPLQIN